MTSIFVDQPSIHYLVGHILAIRGLGSLVKRLYYLEVTLNKFHHFAGEIFPFVF